jgi:hypothetical protein
VVDDGAHRIVRQDVEAELKAFPDAHATERDAEGRRAVVRYGYQPAREVLPGVGPVTVQVRKPGSRWRGSLKKGARLLEGRQEQQLYV